MPTWKVCLHAQKSPYHTFKHAGMIAWVSEPTLAAALRLKVFFMQIMLNGWDHQVLLVRVPESPARYLVAVGFGGPCPIQPVPLPLVVTDDVTGIFTQQHVHCSIAAGHLCISAKQT
jgi:arylamine N-acetyltransferase